MEQLKEDAEQKVDKVHFEFLLRDIVSNIDEDRELNLAHSKVVEEQCKALQDRLKELETIFTEAPNQAHRANGLLDATLLPAVKHALSVHDAQAMWYHKAKLFSEQIYTTVSEFQESVQSSSILQNEMQQNFERARGQFESIQRRFGPFPGLFEEQIQRCFEQVQSAQVNDSEALKTRFQKQLPQVSALVSSQLFTGEQSKLDEKNMEKIDHLKAAVLEFTEDTLQLNFRKRIDALAAFKAQITAKIEQFKDSILKQINRQEKNIQQFSQKNQFVLNGMQGESGVTHLSNMVMNAERQWLQQLAEMRDKIASGPYAVVQLEIEHMITDQLGENVRHTTDAVDASFKQIQKAAEDSSMSVARRYKQLSQQVQQMDKRFRDLLGQCAGLTGTRLEQFNQILNSKLSRASKAVQSMQQLIPAAEFWQYAASKLDKADLEPAFSVCSQQPKTVPPSTPSPRKRILTSDGLVVSGLSLTALSPDVSLTNEEKMLDRLNYGYEEGYGSETRRQSRLQSSLKKSTRVFQDKRQWRNIEASPKEKLDSLLKTYTASID